VPFQFRIRTLLLLVAGVALVLSLYDLLIEARGSGGANLTVVLDAENTSEIRRLDCSVVGQRELAEQVADVRDHTDFQPVVLVERSFTVYIPSWFTSSGLGWRYHHDHFRFLVIWAHYADGTEHCQVVEIPYGMGPRSLVVPFKPGQDVAVVHE
jgi:hypothetical protein